MPALQELHRALFVHSALDAETGEVQVTERIDTLMWLGWARAYPQIFEAHLREALDAAHNVELRTGNPWFQGVDQCQHQ